MTERRDGHSKLVWDKETRSFKTVDPHPETWRQSDEAIRNLIAREIWRYQECEEAYGDFDKVSGDTIGMGALIKQTALDQAEMIRGVILASPVLRARLLADVSTPQGSGK
jgi:hypothetical protein